MGDLTAKMVENDLIKKVKTAIELDVERVDYTYSVGEHRVYCQLRMRNGFVVEGFVFALLVTKESQDIARKQALEKLILIEQYMLAEKLYQQVEYDNQHKRINNGGK